MFLAPVMQYNHKITNRFKLHNMVEAFKRIEWICACPVIPGYRKFIFRACVNSYFNSGFFNYTGFQCLFKIFPCSYIN